MSLYDDDAPGAKTSQVQSPSYRRPKSPGSVKPTSRLENLRPVNNLSIVSRQDITGTYVIDPVMEGPGPIPRSWTSLVIRMAGRVCAPLVALFDDQRSKFLKQQQRNAFFDARRGLIAIDLAIAGSRWTKSFIEVSNRQGPVKVNLFSLYGHINLDISTRQGDAVVLLPPNYDGAVYLQSSHGTFELLPAFTQYARVVMHTDHETLIFFGPTDSPPAQPSWNTNTDYCWVSTRRGKVTVGISGVDKSPEIFEECVVQ